MRIVLWLLVAVLLVLSLVFGVLPYFFGKRTEDEYYTLVERYGEIEGIDAKSIEYNRGWFVSRASTQYETPGLNTVTFTAVDNNLIYHGPFPLQAILKGKIAPKPVLAFIESIYEIEAVETEARSKDPAISFVVQVMNNLPTLESTTTIALDASSISRISIDKTSTDTEEGTRFDFGGLKGQVELGPEIESFKSELDSPGLTLHDEESTLSISSVEGQSDMYYPTTDRNIPLGMYRVSVGEVEFVDPKKAKTKKSGGKIKVNNFSVGGDSELTNGAFDASIKFDVKQVAVDGSVYGPGTYEMVLRNLDYESANQIRQKTQETNIQDPEERNQVLTAELLNVLPELIKHSPELEITNLSLQTDYGDVGGRAKIAVDGSNPEMIANPLFLAFAITADVEFQIAEELLKTLLEALSRDEIVDNYKLLRGRTPSEKEIDELAEEAAEDGMLKLLRDNYFVKNGDQFELKATYTNGEITLNGKPLDISSLLKK